MLFKVRVYKIIWNKEEGEVRDILYGKPDRNKELNELNTTQFFHDVSLEFTPFPGLELSSEDWRSGEIKRVSWDVDEKRFYCYTSDEYPYCKDDDDYDEGFLRNQCLRDGWKLLTVGNS